MSTYLFLHCASAIKELDRSRLDRDKLRAVILELYREHGEATDAHIADLEAWTAERASLLRIAAGVAPVAQAFVGFALLTPVSK